jgi:2-polyprenyl-6-methoxyphenol hydroxylase-like FAD-dependent oxidoreductase
MSNSTQSQLNAKLSVAIAGAGLSGLCLAQALLRAGFEVQVYERDPSPFARRQGYRITVDEHGIGALQRCLPPHLFELFLATAGVPGGSFRFLNQDLGEIFKLTFAADPNGMNLRLPRQADRETLRAVLLSGIQDRVHFGKAAVRADATSTGATLFFADGSSTQASVVVGADGVHSALRAQLLPDCVPVDTGYMAIYGRSLLRQADGTLLVPPPLANSGVLAAGGQGRVFFFTTMHFHELPPQAFARLAPDQEPPIREDYVMWAVLFPTGDLPTNVRKLEPEALHKFASAGASVFHPVLRQLVARAEIDYTIVVQLNAATRPTTWPVSRVTLMGDAVHVMPPFGAHGGNTALHDAALLAEKLQAAVARDESVEHTLGAYQEEMVAYAFREVEASQQMMRRFTKQNPILRWVMLRVIPWARSLTGKSLACAINQLEV